MDSSSRAATIGTIVDQYKSANQGESASPETVTRLTKALNNRDKYSDFDLQTLATDPVKEKQFFDEFTKLCLPTPKVTASDLADDSLDAAENVSWDLASIFAELVAVNNETRRTDQGIRVSLAQASYDTSIRAAEDLKKAGDERFIGSMVSACLNLGGAVVQGAMLLNSTRLDGKANTAGSDAVAGETEVKALGQQAQDIETGLPAKQQELADLDVKVGASDAAITKIESDGGSPAEMYDALNRKDAYVKQRDSLKNEIAADQAKIGKDGSLTKEIDEINGSIEQNRIDAGKFRAEAATWREAGQMVMSLMQHSGAIASAVKEKHAVHSDFDRANEEAAMKMIDAFLSQAGEFTNGASSAVSSALSNMATTSDEYFKAYQTAIRY